MHHETSDAFTTYAYNRVRASIFSLLKQGELCLCSDGEACEFCEQVRNLQKIQEVASVLHDPLQSLQVKKAGADNTHDVVWSKFVKAVLATTMVSCAMHMHQVTHELNSFICLLSLIVFIFLWQEWHETSNSSSTSSSMMSKTVTDNFTK